MANRKLVISINSTWNFINFRAGLLDALASNGYELVAVAPDDGYAEELRGLGCRYVPVPLARRQMSIAGELKLLARYRAILVRERPDAHLSFTIKPNIYGSLAARSLGIPAIANVAGLGTVFLEEGLLNRVVKRMYRAALRPSPITFFQNTDDRDLFIANGIIRSEAARLLPGSGVNLARFSPPPDDTPRGSGPIFLMVARLLWAKGIGEYVKAARRIRSRHPTAEFRLVGMEESSKGAVPPEQLRQWADEGAITFLGAASDVRPGIVDADCIVLPSFYPEGTPRSLLEAAAMARPIITTDVPGCRNVVEHGVNGFLCRPRDVDSLEAVLERFIALPAAKRAEMGVASRALAETRFDEQIVIDAYREALRDVLSEDAPPC